MKIRQGFVSNSSSSSFVIQLNKKIEDYTYTEFLKDYELSDSWQAQRLFRDLHNDINSDILEDWYLDDYLNIDADLKDLRAEEYELFVTELRNKAKDILRDILNKRKQQNIYILEYEDCGGAEMEHYFMPNFKGVKEIISHH